MRNKEFDIARELMDGPWVEPPVERDTQQLLRPASFREIDGRVLASQYVAHRNLVKASLNSKLLDARKPSVPTGAETVETPRATEAGVPSSGNGRLASWARRFLGS